MREYLFILIIAAAVTYLLTPLVRRGAIAMHAQHAARNRDVHKEPTPLLGGVAMYGGLVAGLLVAEQLSYLRQAFPSARTVSGLLLAGACSWSSASSTTGGASAPSPSWPGRSPRAASWCGPARTCRGSRGRAATKVLA